MTRERLWIRAGSALLVASLWALGARAQDSDCLKCHEALVRKANVHAATQIGCAACHANLDASVVPHKVNGKIARGLSAEVPELCQGCHERKSFEGKVTHAPVASGQCLTCHDPHASEQAGLLRKAGAALCLDCHSEVTKKPHVLAGFSGRGHPLGNQPKATVAQDPLRPGRPFYCASCHDPHRADYPRLARFDSKSTIGICRNCHKI